MLRQARENFLAIFHDRQVFEKVITPQVGFQLIVSIGRDQVPKPFSVQLLFGDGLAVVPVVARKMLGQRVRQHLIHIDSNSLHASMVRPRDRGTLPVV